MFQLNWRQREQWHSGTAVKPSSVSTVEQLVTAVGLTLWEEYCAECSAPQCYRSCSLYVPRALIDVDEEVHVMLTCLHFVGFGAAAVAEAEQVRREQVPGSKVRCVAWNLGNTLWQGVIGDAGVEGVTESPVDSVLSCRVAQKQLESHFLRWFVACRAAVGELEFRADYRHTGRNQPLRGVFDELEFTVVVAGEVRQVLRDACNVVAMLTAVIVNAEDFGMNSAGFEEARRSRRSEG